MPKIRLLLAALVLMAIGGCQVRCSTGTGQSASGELYPPMGIQWPETWTMDGKDYDVERSYFLPLPVGMQYTLEYAHGFDKPVEAVTEEEALEIAFPLMRYAYENDVYLRQQTRRAGSGNVTVERIGVVLIKRQGRKVQGYRVGLELDQIAARIRNEKKEGAGQNK